MMLRSALLIVVALGLCNGISVDINGALDSKFDALRDEIETIEHDIDVLKHGSCTVNVIGDAAQHEGEGREINLNLHVDDDRHEEEEDHHEYGKKDIYAHAHVHSSHGGTMKECHGEAYLGQHKDADTLELRLVLEDFDDHDTPHHVYMYHHSSGDCSDMGEIFSPEHHEEGKIGDVITDSHGKVEHFFNHTQLTLEGESSVLGHSIAVLTGERQVSCCGVIGKSNAEHEAYDLMHDHWQDHHGYERDDFYGHSHQHCSNNSRCEIRIAQHSHGNYPPEILVDCEGFADHNHEHDVWVHNLGDISDNCDDIGRKIAHIGKTHTDDHGAIHAYFDHPDDDVVMSPGKNSLAGHAISIYGADNEEHTCCGVVAYSTYANEASHFDISKREHHEEEAPHEWSKLDTYAYAKIEGERGIHGEVHMQQQSGHRHTTFRLDLEGFPDQLEHELYIHTHGMGAGCEGVGKVFDPEEEGSGHIDHFHADDDGVAHDYFHESVNHFSIAEVLGRTIAIHDVDDHPMACGVVLMSSFEEYKRFMEQHQKDQVTHHGHD